MADMQKTSGTGPTSEQPYDPYKNPDAGSRPAWRTTLLIGAVLLIVGVVAMGIERAVGPSATYSGVVIIAVSFAMMLWGWVQYLRRPRS